MENHRSDFPFNNTLHCCPAKIYLVPMGLLFNCGIPFLPTFCPDGTVPLGTKYG